MKQRTPLSRRASCREASTSERSPAFERSGSLRALPSLPPRGLRRGSLLSPSLGEVGKPQVDGGAPNLDGGAPMPSTAKNNNPAAPPSPRPDRGLFLNLTGALFGEGKLQQVLSPTRTGETFFGKSTSGEKGRKGWSPGGSSAWTAGGEDVFTQFSQYGSRAHLAQPDPPEPSSGSRRKTSFEQLRSSEHRRQRKTETKGRCRSREKSMEEVVIRVTDTEQEQQLVQPNTNPIQASCLVPHQQQQQQQEPPHKEPEQEFPPQFESKTKILQQEALQKSNSNSHSHPAGDPQHGDAPGHNRSHQDTVANPQVHPNTSNHQDAVTAQSQSHRNALAHNVGQNPDGASGHWAKKKAPKMPPLHLGGGERIDNDADYNNYDDDDHDHYDEDDDDSNDNVVQRWRGTTHNRVNKERLERCKGRQRACWGQGGRDDDDDEDNDDDYDGFKCRC